MRIEMKKSSMMEDRRIFFAVILAFSIFFISSFMLSSKASAIQLSVSCGNGTTDDCHAITDWPGHVTGADAELTVRGVNVGTIFVTHEMWMVDSNANGLEDCRPLSNSPNGNCWVEAGYTAQGSQSPYPNTERWFWADVRPGYRYSEHDNPVGPLQSGDYGHNVYIYIFHALHNPQKLSFCPYQANEWCIYIQGSATSMTGISGINNSNSMYSTDINIGIEYVGTGGYSPPASFTYNRWQSSRDDSLNYQQNSGEPSYHPPTIYQYLVDPCNCYGNTGGNIMFCISGAGC